MTREERDNAIAILENEKKCVNRANKNDYCNRDCYNCELVKTDTEILTALDMAIQALEQSMPTMVYPQVDGITPTVVAQADEEKTCGTCRNEDTYHCAECENKSDYEQAQADGEYITRILKRMWNWRSKNTTSIDKVAMEMILRDELPSVAIPPEHDGCKDCKYETYLEYYYPCCECKQNYVDEWQKKPHWIEHEHEAGENWEYSRYECSECHEWSDDDSNFCPNCGAKMGGEEE